MGAFDSEIYNTNRIEKSDIPNIIFFIFFWLVICFIAALFGNNKNNGSNNSPGYYEDVGNGDPAITYN